MTSAYASGDRSVPRPAAHGAAFSCALAAMAAVVLSALAGCGVQQQRYTLGDGEEDDWRLVEAPEPGSDEAIIADARRALAEDRPDTAFRLADEWLDGNEFSPSPLVPMAYLIRGDARVARGDEFAALRDYEAVAIQFPGSEEFPTAIEREYEIGVRYLKGLRRKFLGIRFLDARDIGEELLVRVQERMPGTELAERAAIELGDYYLRRQEMDLAEIMYQVHLDNYPRSQNRPEVMRKWIYSTIGQYRGPEHERAPLIDARLRAEQFMSLYPAEAARTGVDESLIARLDDSASFEMIATAQWYLRVGDPPSARFVLNRVLQRYPGTRGAVVAAEMLADLGDGPATPASIPPPELGELAEDQP